ncbi:MAG: hypothetical protein D6741_14570, partial [Planctomycetota bacterium]
MKPQHSIRRSCLFFFAVLGLGCSASGKQELGMIPFDPGIPPIVDPHRLPFPSDLYREGTSLRMEAAPGAVPAIGKLLLPALSKSGFGTQEAVHFGIDGPLPPAPQPITQTGGPAGIVALDDEHGDSLQPAELLIDRQRRILTVMPALGRPLSAARSYLVYVLGDIGLQAAAPFQRIRDRRPKGDAERRALAMLNRPLDRAARLLGIDRDRFVAASLFTPADPTKDLDAIYRSIREGPYAKPRFDPVWHFGGSGFPLEDLFGRPQGSHAGRDNPGGVLHDHVAEVYEGTLPLRQWISAHRREPFRYDAVGAPQERDPMDISFVMAVPDCP